MAGPAPITLRCPRCGQFFSAIPPAGPGVFWTYCPACQYPVPVIHPRDPAPLFTWEVYPQVAPVGVLPEWGGERARRLTGGLLAVGTALLIVMALLSFVTGAGALPSHQYEVSGTVESSSTAALASTPVDGAQVLVTGEGGFHAATFTDASGGFAVPGAPSGAVWVNVSATGYAPAAVELFNSPVYSAPAAGSRGLTIVLSGNLSGSTSSIQLSEFPSLESLVATLWSGAVLFLLVALISGFGGVRDLRRDRPAWGVAGGAAVALSGFLLPELGLTMIVPSGLLLSTLLGTVGLAAFLLAFVRLSARSPPLGPLHRGL